MVNDNEMVLSVAKATSVTPRLPCEYLFSSEDLPSASDPAIMERFPLDAIRGAETGQFDASVDVLGVQNQRKLI